MSLNCRPAGAWALFSHSRGLGARAEAALPPHGGGRLGRRPPATHEQVWEGRGRRAARGGAGGGRRWARPVTQQSCGPRGPRPPGSGTRRRSRTRSSRRAPHALSQGASSRGWERASGPGRPGAGGGRRAAGGARPRRPARAHRLPARAARGAGSRETRRRGRAQDGGPLAAPGGPAGGRGRT